MLPDVAAFGFVAGSVGFVVGAVVVDVIRFLLSLLLLYEIFKCIGFTGSYHCWCVHSEYVLRLAHTW
jgi:hypothetical protein